jgi:hypothetical protein
VKALYPKKLLKATTNKIGIGLDCLALYLMSHEKITHPMKTALLATLLAFAALPTWGQNIKHRIKDNVTYVSSDGKASLQFSCCNHGGFASFEMQTPVFKTQTPPYYAIRFDSKTRFLCKDEYEENEGKTVYGESIPGTKCIKVYIAASHFEEPVSYVLCEKP